MCRSKGKVELRNSVHRKVVSWAKELNINFVVLRSSPTFSPKSLWHVWHFFELCKPFWRRVSDFTTHQVHYGSDCSSFLPCQFYARSLFMGVQQYSSSVCSDSWSSLRATEDLTSQCRWPCTDHLLTEKFSIDYFVNWHLQHPSFKNVAIFITNISRFLLSKIWYAVVDNDRFFVKRMDFSFNIQTLLSRLRYCSFDECEIYRVYTTCTIQYSSAVVLFAGE